jgi:hypothetical protein
MPDTVRRCDQCDGDGKVCKRCGNSLAWHHYREVGMGGCTEYDPVKCDECNGTGYVPLQRD